MAENYTYRPRFGFDIRVKPPKSDARPVWDATARACAIDGCGRKGECRAPKSPDNPRDVLWYCTEHARAHNRAWNFFEGMDERQARAYRESAIYGHRPTWKMGENGWAKASAQSSGAGPRAFVDPFHIFSDQAQSRPTGPYRQGRKLTRLQIKAFNCLELAYDAPREDLTARYKSLVKRFHPDANGGDRSSEARLQEVIRAYEILRRAGFC